MRLLEEDSFDCYGRIARRIAQAPQGVPRNSQHRGNLFEFTPRADSAEFNQLHSHSASIAPGVSHLNYVLATYPVHCQRLVQLGYPPTNVSETAPGRCGSLLRVPR